MHKQVKAVIQEEKPNGTLLRVLVPSRLNDVDLERFAKDGIIRGELRIDDGRTITSDQRKKAYATMADIATHTGHMPEELKEIMKYWYISKTGAEYFSLSNCSVTTARLFINYLIDFALEWHIPLLDSLVSRTDDITAAIYSSLMHKRCVICGADGELHHTTAVGMGFDREKIVHLGMSVMCLCRKHHTECHTVGQERFNERYMVYGIEATEEICKVYKLKSRG